MASPVPALTGGCLCGAVRYAVDSTPTRAVHCHCGLCRRATGAPYVSWFLVPTADFKFTQGAPVSYASSERAKRRHCAVCGTQLTFQFNQRQDFLVVTVGSLDVPAAVTPTEHVFWDDRVPSLIDMAISVRQTH